MSQQVIVMTPDEVKEVVNSAVQSAVSHVLRDIAKTKNIMTEEEAAGYVGQKQNTLRFWRGQSKGPAYQKFAKGIRYAKKDLDDWMASNKVHTSDSRPVGGLNVRQ